MKLRKQLKWLYRSLQEQIQGALSNHLHAPFHIKGSGCMLCRLIDVGFPLATLQLARENGIHTNWLPAELELANLIGHEVYKKRVKREMVLVKNLPKKMCVMCKGTIISFTTLSQIAKHLLKNQKDWYTNCGECGYKCAFTKKDIPIKLLTVVRKRLLATLKRRRAMKIPLDKNYAKTYKNLMAEFGIPLSTSTTTYNPNPSE